MHSLNFYLLCLSAKQLSKECHPDPPTSQAEASRCLVTPPPNPSTKPCILQFRVSGGGQCVSGALWCGWEEGWGVGVAVWNAVLPEWGGWVEGYPHQVYHSNTTKRQCGVKAAVLCSSGQGAQTPGQSRKNKLCVFIYQVRHSNYIKIPHTW